MTKSKDTAINTVALTKREQEIFTSRQNGLSQSEIAKRLCIAEGTVKRHLANIAAKTRNRREIE